MTFTTALISLAGIAFAVVVFLWEFGADRILSRIGCLVIRILTFNRIKIPIDRINNTAEISAGAATLICFLIVFVVLSSFFH